MSVRLDTPASPRNRSIGGLRVYRPGGGAAPRRSDAGYEATLGHDVTASALARVSDYLTELHSAVLRLAGLFEIERVIVTAGRSTCFDAVADVLTGAWPAGMTVRTIVRGGVLPHPRRRAVPADLTAA
jgi:hypothetical protein